MKLCRYGKAGYEKPGMIDDEGRLRDLSKVVDTIGPNELSPRGLKMLARLKPETLPLVTSRPRFGVPYVGIGKFVAIGLNYSDHAAESGMPVPKEPIVFMKTLSCIQGPDDDIMIPRNSVKTDWEVELGIVMGSTARYVSKRDALNYVAGYVLVNDVSEREFQLERGGAWDKGKGCDTFGPLGPWLVSRDEIADPHQLSIWLEVDGHRYQNGNTRTMIFQIPKLISYLSQFMSLQPGDVISTGTPPGVGLGIKPTPVYLKPGQKIRLGIEGLGEQNQTTVDA